MFESFRELSDKELDILYEKIRKFQQTEREWQDFLSTLPKGYILNLTYPELNDWRKWMLRDGYYVFKNLNGTRFARKIAREIIKDETYYAST